MVATLAVPAVSVVDGPIAVEPSLNCTLPVGVVIGGAVSATVAVRTTD